MHILIHGITTANQARLKQKFDSIYFLNKVYLICLFLSLFCTKDQIQFMFFCSLELKLQTKQDIAKEKIHLLLFIKCIRNNLIKAKQ